MAREQFYLKPHNKQASKAISSAFKKGQNIVSIVEVTGGGKTFVALDQAMKMYPKKMLFVVPELEIMAHIQRTISTYALKDKVNIEFITYQSLVNKSKKELEKMQFDMLVVDEFHHMGAPIWGTRIEQLVESHQDAHILGMSAYHVRNRGKVDALDVAPTLAELELEEDDLTDDQKEDLPLFTDSVVFRYELAEALVDGVLPTPKYVACNIKLIEYAKRIQEKIEESTATKEEKALYSQQIRLILKNLEKAGNFEDVIKEHINPGDKCIYFAPQGVSTKTKQRKIDEVVKKLKQTFPDAIIYSTTAKDLDGAKNREAFYNDKDLDGNDVSGKLRIMVALKQYDQGVHAPNVNAVVMGVETKSDIVFGERLGRALSVGSQKDIKVVDMAGNIDYIIDLQNACYDIFKKKQEERKRQGKDDGETPVDASDFKFILDSYLDLVDILKKLEEVDRVFDDWNLKCNQYFAFHEQNNRWPSPKSKDKAERSLGIWGNAQRVFKRKNILAPKREKILLEMGFIFDPLEENFWENLRKDKAFRESHNGNAPSNKSKDAEERQLARWEKNCRTRKKRGTLTPEQEKALLEIGWQFDPKEENFWENLRKDKAFRESHNGEAPSSYSKDAEERQLARWEVNCRIRKKRGTLTPEQEKALLEIGWQFDPLEENFWENLRKDKAFRESHNGNAPSRRSKDSEERQLADWENNCRTRKKMGTLTPEQEKALLEIGWQFNPLEERWQANFEVAKKSIKETGNLPKSNENPAVYEWNKKNKKGLEEGKITVEHFKQLKRAKLDPSDKEQEQQAITEFFESTADTSRNPKK